MRPTSRPLRAFSLVEMMIAVGILVLLVGITVSAGSALMTRSEVRQTQNTLRLLELALEEWELTTDRSLSWGAVEGQSDLWQARAHNLIISELLDAIRRHPRSREILAQIDPKFIYTYVEGETPPWIQGAAAGQLDRFVERKSITVLDAWGWPIYATHPGPLDVNTPAADIDGTIRTPNEVYFGPALHRQVNLISAGPDTAFGRVAALDGSAPKEQTKDNVYLYALAKE